MESISMVISVVGLLFTLYFGYITKKIDANVNGVEIIEKILQWIENIKTNIWLNHLTDLNEKIDNNGEVTSINIQAKIYCHKIRNYNKEIYESLKCLIDLREDDKYKKLLTNINDCEKSIMNYLSNLEKKEK